MNGRPRFGRAFDAARSKTPDPMERLFEAVRKAALPAVWTQGVKLARQEAVSRESTTKTSQSFRVRAAGHVIAPSVTLYPADGEWSCDCGGHADPCAHVAAAVIAANQAGAKPLPTAPAAPPVAPPRLVYRLMTRNRELTLTRVIVHPDGRQEPVTALASDIARGRLPRTISPTHADLTLDRLLSSKKDAIPFTRLKDFFPVLANVEHITFAGKKVTVSAEPLLPRALVEDGPKGGFVLRLERDPAAEEMIALGVVRSGDSLRFLGETTTTGPMLERLPLVRTFTAEQQADLVAHVLPEIELKLKVELRTQKLPRANTTARPRISFDLSHHGHTLSVLPTLVYGDPAVLRIDGEEAKALGNEVPIRRREEERALLQKLRDDLNLVTGRRVDLDGSEAVRFAAKLRNWQKGTGKASSVASSDQVEFREQPLNARLVVEGDAFDIVFETEPDESGNVRSKRASSANVLQAWRDGLDLVPLDGGGWAPLPAGWLEQHGQRVEDLLTARDAQHRVPTALLPELGVLCEAFELERPRGLERLQPILENFDGIPHTTLPSDLNAELRGYQQVGVDWLVFLRDAGLGAVLADDMGLGKTLQTICALRGRALVICPKSVVYNWAEEISRFRPGIRTAIYHGVRRELDAGADVTLTTYAVLRLDVAELAAEKWDIVVLDEAQAIKNSDSQTARAAFQLNGDFRVALSGTPVENRLEELWSVMQFANPGLLGKKSTFQERTVSPIAAGDPGAAERLRARIRPFVLRRMKRDVLPELPPRTDAVLHVELDEAERSVYDAVRAATVHAVAEQLGHGGGVLAALEALLRLRQACCHSGLVPGQVADRSSKIDRLVEALEEAAADGHKALVFSQWTGLLDRVEPHLRAAGVTFTRLDGSTEDRGAVVNEFQRESGPPVMLVSLKAGGTGLNLTAADHVFLLDPWWNPAVEDQAADRAHRIGQERPVMLYRMVAKDTVEERILALQAKKRALSDVALGEAGQAASLTREDLLSLLE
jgi:superfamily II DNA or RNA helicase